MVIGIKVEIVLVVRNIQNRFIQIVEEKVNNVENVINTTNSFERFRVKIFSYNNKEPRIVFSRVREKKLRLWIIQNNVANIEVNYIYRKIENNLIFLKILEDFKHCKVNGFSIGVNEPKNVWVLNQIKKVQIKVSKHNSIFNEDFQPR